MCVRHRDSFRAARAHPRLYSLDGSLKSIVFGCAAGSLPVVGGAAGFCAGAAGFGAIGVAFGAIAFGCTFTPAAKAPVFGCAFAPGATRPGFCTFAPGAAR